MFSRSEIIEQTTDYLVDECGLPRDEVAANEPMFGSGRLDSIEVLKIICFLEEAFQVSVPMFEVSFENFQTVSCVADVVEQQQVKKAA